MVVASEYGTGDANSHNCIRNDITKRKSRYVTVIAENRMPTPVDATMLDAGTYTLDALERATRLAIKRLGLAVAEQLA